MYFFEQDFVYNLIHKTDPSADISAVVPYTFIADTVPAKVGFLYVGYVVNARSKTFYHGTRSFDIDAPNADSGGWMVFDGFDGSAQASLFVGWKVTLNFAVFSEFINAFNVTVVIPTNNFFAKINVNSGIALRIDWGDGQVSLASDGTHTYAFAGTYKILISGSMAVGGYLQFGIAPATLGGCLSSIDFIESSISIFSAAFKDCTLLSEIPSGMFARCPDVTNVVNLFSGCTGINKPIPVGLFDSCLKLSNVQNAFYLCSSMPGPIPVDLFAKNTAITYCSSLFSGCSNLDGVIPSGLFDNFSKVLSFQNVFYNCLKISGSIPPKLFDKCISANTFGGTFQSCGVGGAIPVDLFKFCPEVTSFGACFRETKITSIPVDFFRYNTKNTTFSTTFYRCVSLSSPLPAHLFDYCPLVTSFASCFYFCTLLPGVIPVNFFDFNLEVTSFGTLFSSCALLTSLPSGLFRLHAKADYFLSSFSNCTGLTGVLDDTFFHHSAPATNFANCLLNCNKLTGSAPLLWVRYPALDLASTDNCFAGDNLLTNFVDIPTNWK
jgi:hypothetical protein